MAIVIWGTFSGRIVDVVEFVGTAMFEDGKIYHDVWHVTYKGTRLSKTGILRGQSDSHLIPIRPSDLKETEETERVVFGSNDS